MQIRAHRLLDSAAFVFLGTTLLITPLHSQQPTFRNAPASATQMKNPYAGNAAAAASGAKLYTQDCSQCHGNHGQGMGPAPALDSALVHKANAGELFWFISTGKLTSGMPGWANLPKQQRWQIVTFLQSLSPEKAGAK